MLTPCHRVLVAITAAAASFTSVATAGPTRVAIVGVEIGGDGAPELQTQLAESVVSGVKAAKLTAIELPDVRDALRDTPELIGCISTTCLARIGDKLGADGFLRGKVEAEGADYTVTLELYNTTELIHRVEKACSVCTIGELNTLAQTTAKLLVEGASDSPVQVIIRTEPSGAELTIDGLGQGPAPFEGPLSPGPHLVVARAASGKIVRERIEVTEATAAEPIVIRIEEPVVVPTPQTPTVDRPFGPWKWVTAAGAATAVAAGVTLLAIDGRGTCDDGGRECPEIYDTQLGGFGALGLGIGLGALAGYMFYTDAQTEPVVTAVPTAGGASVSLHMRF